MINLKSLQKLAQPSSVPAAARCIVFDGKTAVTVARAQGSARWWAGVPHVQEGLSRPLAVPVDSIKSHLLRSRHLMMDEAGLHNGAGMRTGWAADHPCVGAAALLPAMPAGAPVARCEIVLDVLDRVAIAAAVHDVRDYLQGVLLDFDNGVLVATDGLRLHCHGGGVPVVQGAGRVILPVEAVKWLLHSAGDVAEVTVWRAGNGSAQVLMRASDAFVFAHGLDGRYPDWQRVVPAMATRGARFRVDPVALASAVEAMGRLHKLEGKAKRGIVSLDLVAGQVRAGNSPDRCAVVEMTVDTGAGEPFAVSFTADLVQDVADCVGVGAQWGMPRRGEKGPDGPLLVLQGSFVAVVMPCREPERPPVGDVAEEVAEAEPCPAAVAAVAAQLVSRVSAGAAVSAKRGKHKARRPVEPVEA